MTVADTSPDAPSTAAIGSPVAAYPDLWAYYEQLRELGDVVWDETTGAWAATSYELCRETARGENGLWDPYPVPGSGDPMPAGLDEATWLEVEHLGSNRILPLGGQHPEQHRWWMRLFTPRIVKSWQEEFIRPICHAQIDRIEAAGRADLVADYAARIAPRVLVGLMGVPDADDAFTDHLTDLFEKRNDARQSIFTATRELDRALIDAAVAAAGALREALRDLVLSRRDGHGDDVISALWRDAEQFFGPGWDENDVIGMAVLIWDAGTGTTVASTANGLQMLLTRPDLLKRVIAEPGLIPNVIEESFRMYGPVVQNRTRIARKDFEFGGVQIRTGDLIMPIYGTANRDPSHYPNANEIDLDRDAPRDHLSFGTGPRSCVGQAIARQELEDSLAVLLERLPDIELDPDAEPPVYGHGITLRLWKPLNVRFEPRTAGGGQR
jgi:cytochrome P450